jgi:hypothetical protein
MIRKMERDMKRKKERDIKFTVAQTRVLPEIVSELSFISIIVQ